MTERYRSRPGSIYSLGFLGSLVCLTVVGLVTWTAIAPFQRAPVKTRIGPTTELQPAVDEVNRVFETRWAERNLTPAQQADDLQVLRRLSLALLGTIPSLEEIRQFEADTRPERLRHWTVRLMNDPRFADFFAQRLALSFVGDTEDKYPLFSRARFVSWIGQQLQQNRPFDELVREMISQKGLWTDRPALHFQTAQIGNGGEYKQRLAGRTVRAFLGQRMDCAQCHDHPFAEWTQNQFEGFAGFYGQVKLTPVGVQDQPNLKFEVEHGKETVTVEPAVPFGADWLPDSGSWREKLAVWVTHPDNRRFERAGANRIWYLMFGKAYVTPVDDIPNPPAEGKKDATELLDVLGADFRASGYNLRRLIEVIASSRPFRLDSRHPQLEDEKSALDVEAAWAVFPLTHIGSDRLFYSLRQAATLLPIERNENLVIFLAYYFNNKKLIREYGDPGENGQEEQGGTITQALMRMNSPFVRERSEAKLLTASGRISWVTRSPEDCLEMCYLVCLSRRPSEFERSRLLPQLQGITNDDIRGQVVEDLFWALYNSEEFSWNH